MSCLVFYIAAGSVWLGVGLLRLDVSRAQLGPDFGGSSVPGTLPVNTFACPSATLQALLSQTFWIGKIMTLFVWVWMSQYHRENWWCSTSCRHETSAPLSLHTAITPPNWHQRCSFVWAVLVRRRWKRRMDSVIWALCSSGNSVSRMWGAQAKVQTYHWYCSPCPLNNRVSQARAMP